MLNADGSPATAFSAYQGALGVKSVAWNGSGELLAVGSYDEVGRRGAARAGRVCRARLCDAQCACAAMCMCCHVLTWAPVGFS